MIKSIDIIDIINSKEIKHIIDILDILDILDIIDPIEMNIICICDNIYINDTIYILDVWILQSSYGSQCQWRRMVQA